MFGVSLFCYECFVRKRVYNLLLCLLSGDILIFMPGQEDIEVTCELIAGIHYFVCAFF